MHFAGILDILATLGFLAATVLALQIKKGNLGYAPRILMAAAMSIYALVGLSNTLEHLEITDRFDRYEDYFEILFVPLFLFGAFALRAEAAFADRNRAEQALRESEERFRTLVERAGDALFLISPDARFVDVNHEACDVLGYQRSELLALSVPDIDLMYQKEQYDQFVARFEASQTATVESVLRCKDGSTRPAETRVSWIEIKGKPHLLALVRDITDRKQAEQERRTLESQLRQSQKMEAVGQLGGGVAHDFNNLLTVILGNAQIALRAARRGPSQMDKIQELLGQIRTAGDRGAALTQQLLTFSRKQIPDPRSLDLNEIIAGMENMLQRLIGEHIEVRSDLAKNLDRILADKGQVEQIILNLALNARDAMPDGGLLTIETANVVLDQAYVHQHIDSQPGPHVMAAVKDTGHGMSQEVLERIFEPFFTTKPIDKGTGLGLAVVYGIVKQARGHITAQSEPNEGTTFRLYFPSHTEVADSSPKIESATPAIGGHETILLCEDEDMVRKFACECLTDAGYNVIEAPNSHDALQIAAQSTQQIHLLITDLVMPEIDGRKLTRLLRQGYPNLKVLYMSGYTSDLVLDAESGEEAGEFIQKPFEIDEFLLKVRHTIDTPTT